MKSAASGGAGCLVIFGAIFAIAGLVPGALALSSVRDWAQARDWIEVPAQVLEAKLERGDDTFRATAHYRYEYQGIEHHGDRVSFHSGSDNIGDFHQDIYRLLDQHRRDGQPINVYVNPRTPAEAVVRRDLRLGMIGFLMIFPLVFGSAGIGIILYALAGGRRLKETRKRQALYPDEPWRWRAQWDNGVLRNDTAKTLWFAGFFALVWNLISLPLPFFLWGEVTEKGNFAALIGLLFPLVGLGLIIWLVRLWLADKRYGRATFTLDKLPGALGDRLSGELRVPASLPEGSTIMVYLDCVRRRTTGSGKHRSTTEDLLWQDEQRLPLQPHPLMQGTRVPIVFPLPSDRPATDDSNPKDKIIWRLRMEAEVPGVDFSTSFEVPVYDVGTDAAGAEQPQPISQAAEPPDWKHTGVELRYGAEGVEYYFAPARHKGMASGLTLIAVIFVGASIALWGADQSLMAIIFSLFSLILVWATLHSWLIRSRLMPGHGRLRLQRGYSGSGRLREISAADIGAITLKAGTRAGTTQYYDLVAQTTGGKAIRLADMLKGRRDSEALAQHIAESIGIADRKPSR